MQVGAGITNTPNIPNLWAELNKQTDY
jgi:hypothetical protein